jgi:hypothetical protein
MTLLGVLGAFGQAAGSGVESGWQHQFSYAQLQQMAKQFEEQLALQKQALAQNQIPTAQSIAAKRAALPFMDRATTAINARFAQGPAQLGQAGSQIAAEQAAAAAFKPGQNPNIQEYDAATRALMARLGVNHAGGGEDLPATSAATGPAPAGNAPITDADRYILATGGPMGGGSSIPLPAAAAQARANARRDATTIPDYSVPPPPVGGPATPTGGGAPSPSSEINPALLGRFVPPGSSPMASSSPTATAGTKPTAPGALSDENDDPTTGAAIRRRLTSPAYAY